MFPEYFISVLQQLSYISLIVMCPCMLYVTLRYIAISERLDSHIQMDDMRFKRVNEDIGKHDSQINDLRADRASGLASTIENLIRSNGRGKA